MRIWLALALAGVVFAVLAYQSLSSRYVVSAEQPSHELSRTRMGDWSVRVSYDDGVDCYYYGSNLSCLRRGAQ